MFACSLRPLPGARPVWQCLIHGNRSGSDAREERQLSTRKRRVAGLPRGGVRPARLCEPQEQRLFAMRFVLGAPPRTGAFGHSDRAASTPIRGQRFCKSRYSLLAYNSPPRGVAADCATLKGRKSTTNGSAQSQANSSPHSVGFGLRAPRVGRRPSAQARRFYEPQKHHPIHHQSAEFVFGRSQRRTKTERKRSISARIRGLRADR